MTTLCSSAPVGACGLVFAVSGLVSVSCTWSEADQDQWWERPSLGWSDVLLSRPGPELISSWSFILGCVGLMS